MVVLMGYLPGFYAGKFIAISYNPDRAAWQVGFDQGVPHRFPPPESSNIEDVIARFNRYVFKGATRLSDQRKDFSFRLPIPARLLAVTEGAHEYHDLLRRRALNFLFSSLRLDYSGSSVASCVWPNQT